MAHHTPLTFTLDGPFRPGDPWFPLPDPASSTEAWPAPERSRSAEKRSPLDGSGETSLPSVPDSEPPSFSAPLVRPAAPTLIAADPLSRAAQTRQTDLSSPAVDDDPEAAAPLRIQVGRCTCPVCSGLRVPTGAGTNATPTGGTASLTTLSAVPLQSLADYLTTGYWREAGTYTRKYNLTSSGTGAKSGTITYNLSGWANDANGLSTERRTLAREVFKVYAAVLGVNFREVTGTGGDIRFTDNDTGAYAYLASGWYSNAELTAATVNYSVVNVEATWHYSRSDYNSYTPQTFFHEIGHALGLGHQGQYNYTGTPLTYSSSAQFANDSWQATMMSYWSQEANPTTGATKAWLQTPMAVDWIGLNDLYRSQGFSTDNAFRGDTIYGVGTNISSSVSDIWNKFSSYAGLTAYTLVDGSGYDKLDVSNFAANQLINLAPSQPGSTTPSTSNIGGIIGNLTIAAGTIIEAANGGSGADKFYGNDAANTFWGNGGDDSFYDSLGADIYYGDSGNDWLYFSESIDLFNIEISGTSLLFSRTSGGGDVDRAWEGLENLSFNNVAYSYQQLVDTLTVNVLPTVTINAANGTLASGAITNVTAITLSGSLNKPLGSNQSITLYRDGVAVGTATSDGVGSTGWSYALQEADGSSTIAYTAQVVEAGTARTGTLSSPFQLTVDTVAPAVSVNPLETQNTTPLLSGTVNDGAAIVSVTIGDQTRTAVNNGSGGWTLQWETPLSAGVTYDVSVSAVDKATNVGRDNSSGELTIRPDDFSADSTTTGLVTVGSSASGLLELQGDRDWFKVDLQAGRTYELRLNGTTLADPMLRLRNSVGSELASNDNAAVDTFNSLITYAPTASGTYFLEAAASNNSSAGSYTLSAADITPPPPPPSPRLFFSLANPISTASPSVLGGLTARTNDIIAFDGTSFSTWLDGNANGLTGAVLRDFDIINNNEIVVAFQNPITLSGIAFDTSDLAKVTRNTNGATISMLFDGSDVGLTTSTTSTIEAIDAVTGMRDGSWLISTRGGGTVSGINGFAPEDLLRFVPTSLGTNTAGSWSFHADMSDVGLISSTSNPAENVTAIDVGADGRFFLSTAGNASATGLTAAREDVFVFAPTQLGSTTKGAFQPLFFDGSVYGLSTNALQGIDMPNAA